MKHLMVKSSLLAASVVTAMVACGGGSDDARDDIAAAQALADTRGQVINSYIQGATVVLDVNDDGICEASEPRVTTDASGAYTFKGQGAHMVCATGGTNTVTGLAFVGRLVAPPQATVVTPLTTLIVAQARSALPALEQGKAAVLEAAAVAAAQTAIMTRLSLPSGVSVLTTDPVALMNKQGAIAADAQLEQVNAAVQVLLQQTAQAIIASANLPPAAAAEAVNEAFNAAVAGFQAALVAAGATPIDLRTASDDATRKLISDGAARASAAASTNPVLLQASRQFAALSSANVAAAIAATPLADAVRAVASATAASLASKDGAERAALVSTQVADAVRQINTLLVDAADVGAASQAAINRAVARLAPPAGTVPTQAEVEAAVKDAVTSINNALPPGSTPLPVPVFPARG